MSNGPTSEQQTIYFSMALSILVEQKKELLHDLSKEFDGEEEDRLNLMHEWSAICFREQELLDALSQALYWSSHN